MTDQGDHAVLALDPETVSPADVSPETLQSGLDCADNRTRVHAARVAASVATDDPDAVAGLVPTLVDALEDERTLVVVHSSLALRAVAESDPVVVEPAVDSLVDCLGRDAPVVQAGAAEVMKQFLSADVGPFLDELDRLVEYVVSEPADGLADGVAPPDGPAPGADPRQAALESVLEDDRERRRHARIVVANLVAELATVAPERVAPHVPELSSVLDPERDDAATLTTVADVIATVAEHDPDAAAAAVDPLIDVLDHPDLTTVATSITALGYVGDPAAAEPVRAVATERDDEDLCALAAETAAFLDPNADTAAGNSSV